MVQFGYKLMTEEHGPQALLANAQRAEDAGFDFVSISDHFHPWLESHRHAPFAWSVLGAIAATTSQVGITTGLTCPIIRYHPAIVAQAAATIAVMSGGRFALAIGGGERLNEHVTGARWPSNPERREMLGEAIDIFRTLWKGGARTWRGKHFEIDNAQLYDLPEAPIQLTLGVAGPRGVELAAEKDCGVMATDPDAKLVQDYLAKAREPGPLYAECTLAYASSEDAALDLLHERFRFGALGWAAMSELPTVAAFESASRHVRKEDLKHRVGLGPDVESHLAAIRAYVEAGFDHVVLLAVGDDQPGFIDFFERSLKPRLGELAAKG